MTWCRCSQDFFLEYHWYKWNQHCFFLEHIKVETMSNTTQERSKCWSCIQLKPEIVQGPAVRQTVMYLTVMQLQLSANMPINGSMLFWDQEACHPCHVELLQIKMSSGYMHRESVSNTDLFFNSIVKGGQLKSMKDVEMIFPVATSLSWYTWQVVFISFTLMLCGLNQRALYPQLTGIVFDLASIMDAGKVVRTTRPGLCLLEERTEKKTKIKKKKRMSVLLFPEPHFCFSCTQSQ